ncbi:type IV secretion system DNA-binding domain-containing protein [Pseudophaeobacter sp.]|uniref:type IV secretory system conjugative DNA transfer family protein n=1 Tax=Pseudophaeobacter sp. TaxID=1971739 RepID=UPI00329946AA
MRLKDYQDFGLRELNLELAGADSIGRIRVSESDEVVEHCIQHRLQVVASAIDNIYHEHGDDMGLSAEQSRQLLTFDQYLSTVKGIDSIRSKLADAERDIPYQGRRMGNPAEDKIAAKIIEKKTGYNPTENWKQADKTNEARRKLYSQYDATTLHLARNFSPHVHTPDRTGYLYFIEGQDAAFISALKEALPVTPLISEIRRHAYITGGSGSGKTELLKQLIHAAYHRFDEATIVIDPHGDLAEQVAHWEMFVDDDRLIYIDPYFEEEHVPAFNPLIVPEDTSMQQREVIAQQLVNAFEQLLKGSSGDSLTVNMRTVLMPCILTLLDQQGSTLADLQRFMNDRLNEDLIALGEQSNRRAIRDFFKYDFSGDPTLRPSKSAISRKLQSLFNTFAFDEVVNSPVSLDLEAAINQGKVILFNLSKGRMGDEASEAFGRLVVAAVQGLALRRADIPEDQRTPINLFIDECQNYIAPATMQILEEARKYGVSLTLAQQVVGRGMSSEMQTVVLNNTNVKAAGRTPEDDKLAKILGKTQADVQALQTGHFWMKVGNGSTFKLEANSDLVGDDVSMTPDQWAAIKQQQLRHYRNLNETAAPPPASESLPDDGSPMAW